MKPKQRIVGLIILCGIFAAGQARAENDRSKPGRDSEPGIHTSITLRIYLDFLVVAEGQFGSGQEPQNFVLDTGTAPSIINARIVKKLGLATTLAEMSALHKVIPTQTAILPEVHLGPIRAISVRVQVLELSQLEHDLGIPVAGIIGMDVLSKSNFRLDYDTKRLEFGDVSAEGISVSFDAHSGLAVARVKVAGEPARMLVDTGTNLVALLQGSVKGTEGLALRSTAQEASSVADRAIGLKAFITPDIVLGGQHFTVQKAYFVSGTADPRFDGLLGVRALGFRAIAYDQSSRAIYLQK